MIGETYGIVVQVESLKKVKDALVLQDDWCISLGDDAVQMLNRDGKSSGKKKGVSPKDSWCATILLVDCFPVKLFHFKV